MFLYKFFDDLNNYKGEDYMEQINIILVIFLLVISYFN